MFKLIEYCFEINVQGMLGVDSASARPCFDGTTRGSSRISGLSRHVAVVNLALVCVGYNRYGVQPGQGHRIGISLAGNQVGGELSRALGIMA